MTPDKAVRASLLLFCLLAAPLSAGEPDKKPILRIETGKHTAKINALASDQKQRFVATASNDKTLRLWSLPDGQLLDTFRPPIAAGNEGKLYAVAVSPDGKTIACGGWTNENNGNSGIYVFGRDGGSALLLGGLPQVIYKLAFSPDGAWLVAGLGGANGIRIYRTSDYRLVHQDADYQGDCYGLSFKANGLLASTAYDGQIRLYDRNFQLSNKHKLPTGFRPHELAFSPDGNLLAVGNGNHADLVVLAATDLTVVFQHKLADQDNLGSVAWSPDGQVLYAGGQYNDVNGNNPIVAWDKGGRGRQSLLEGSSDTVMGLLPLARGGLLFATADAVLGAYDGTGKPLFYHQPDTGNLWNELQLANAGQYLSFPHPSGKGSLYFDVAATLLRDEQGSGISLLPPKTSAPGLEIKGVPGYEPSLNGQKLALNAYEYTYCHALAPLSSRFVLGTNYGMGCYDGQGKQLWRNPVPASCRKLNLTEKLVVASFGDGTIHWYRLSDGVELLALFPHRDGKNWLLWSPDGYYAASAGGEDLLGWHLNQSEGQLALFYPASRFRATYNRPDVLKRILETLDPATALAQADAELGRRRSQLQLSLRLPPIVTILSPQNGASFSSSQLEVSLRIQNPAGQSTTNIKAKIDGRPVSLSKGFVAQASETNQQTIHLSLPQQDCELSVLAYNNNGASQAASVTLHWSGTSFESKPKLYLLAVGVGEYANPKFKLNFPAKDAEDFANIMKKQKGGLYRDVEVKLLKDKDAIKNNVLDGMEWLQKETTSLDVAMLFLSGHGINDSNGFYFLPHEADLDHLFRSALPFSDIKRTLGSLAGKTVFFVDSCHAGAALGPKTKNPEINRIINELIDAENGAVVFAASSSSQLSLEDPSWANGAFTRALVEGLEGAAAYTANSNRITINMLELYIAERVKELTGGRQSPTVSKPHAVNDFPIAIKP